MAATMAAKPVANKERFTDTLSYVGTCISMLCGGSTSLFATYGPSLSDILGFTQYDTNLVASLGDYAHYLCAPMFGYLTTRIGPRRVIQCAGILMFLGYFGFGYTLIQYGDVQEGHGAKVATMSLLFALVGMGSKAAYMASMSTTAHNFKASRYSGIALGIPISLYGLSTFVFSSLKAQWFEADSTPVRYLKFMAIVSFIAHVFSAHFVVLKEGPIPAAYRRSRATTITRASSNGAAAAAANDATRDGEMAEGIEMKETRRRRATLSEGTKGGIIKQGQEGHEDTPTELKSAPKEPLSSMSAHEKSKFTQFAHDPIAWALLLGLICSAGPGLAFVNNCGSMVRALAYDTTLTAEQIGQYKDKIVATQSFFSFSSRLLIGYISDIWRSRFRLPRSGLLIVGVLILIHAQNTVAYVKSLDDLYPLAVLIGISMGSIFTLAPTITSETWGAENFGICWGFITLGPAIGGHICNLIFGASWDDGFAKIVAKSSDGVGQGSPGTLDPSIHNNHCDYSCFAPAFATTTRITYLGLFFFSLVLGIPKIKLIWKRQIE